MIKPAIKSLLILLWSLLLFFPVWFSYLLKKYVWRDRFMRIASRGILKISGIQLTVSGALSAARPLLVVSNHISYMDILILSSQEPLHFTPKSEIAKWPLIGYICKITGCVFVERKPGKVKEMAVRMRQKLESGEVISLFPESTTGGGVHVLPFKSSFFSLAEETFVGGTLQVQPLALTYTGASNLPMDLRLWHQVAWIGDMELVPHLWEFLSLSPVKAELHFLPPVTLAQYGNRKALAAGCQSLIEEEIEIIRAKSYAPVTAPQASSMELSWFKDKS